MLISDIILWMAVAFLSPILGIFINDRLIGGSIFAAGLATTLVFFVKAIILIPIGEYNDRDPGNRREFNTFVAGIFIMSAVPISYLFITRIEHFYLSQIVYGIGFALYYPGWFTIWTRFVDGAREGRSWSVYGALTSLTMGIAAVVGGYIAEFMSFNTVFAAVAVFGFISTIFLFMVRKEICDWPKAKGRGNRARV